LLEQKRRQHISQSMILVSHDGLIRSLVCDILGMPVYQGWNLQTNFGIVPLAFAFTRVYNNTNRSTPAVILFHSMVNFTGGLLTLSERADTYSILLWFVVAIGITNIWSAKAFRIRSRHYGDSLVRGS
jgi:hypothetical protein